MGEMESSAARGCGDEPLGGVRDWECEWTAKRRMEDAVTPAMSVIVGILISVAFTLGGRWVQLHPERVVPKGWFVGPNTFGARLFRGRMAVLGTFAVFVATWIAISSILSLFAFSSVILWWEAQLLSAAAGQVLQSTFEEK
jgi:hypothetical protein